MGLNRTQRELDLEGNERAKNKKQSTISIHTVSMTVYSINHCYFLSLPSSQQTSKEQKIKKHCGL